MGSEPHLYTSYTKRTKRPPVTVEMFPKALVSSKSTYRSTVTWTYKPQGPAIVGLTPSTGLTTGAAKITLVLENAKSTCDQNAECEYASDYLEDASGLTVFFGDPKLSIQQTWNSQKI